MSHVSRDIPSQEPMMLELKDPRHLRAENTMYGNVP